MTKTNESERDPVTKVTEDLGAANAANGPISTHERAANAAQKDDDYPEVPGEHIDPDTGEVLGPLLCAEEGGEAVRGHPSP